MDREGWSTQQAREQLLSHGGLAGVSGVAGGDVRDVEEKAGSGDARAQLAIDLFCYEIRKTIGAYAAAMGGIDVLTFTGGIGENSATVRALATKDLAFLGIRVDPVANLSWEGDRLISYDEAAVKVAVLATNEEIIVGRETAQLLSEPEA
jgi:acetate kinase